LLVLTCFLIGSLLTVHVNLTVKALVKALVKVLVKALLLPRFFLSSETPKLGDASDLGESQSPPFGGSGDYGLIVLGAFVHFCNGNGGCGLVGFVLQGVKQGRVTSKGNFLHSRDGRMRGSMTRTHCIAWFSGAAHIRKKVSDR
jgi:hypothetical protein